MAWVKLARRVIEVTGVLALAGCVPPGGLVRQADIVPLNEAATAAGTPTLTLVLYGTGYGPVTGTMPDGESLTGHYHLARDDAVAIGLGTAFGPRGGVTTATGVSAIQPTEGAFVLQAAGNRGTTIVCHGTAGGMGHGDMVCSTNHGAQYQVIF